MQNNSSPSNNFHSQMFTYIFLFSEFLTDIVNNYSMTKTRFIMSRISKQMKGRGFTEPFHRFNVPSVINRFIFGHGVVIYFIMQSLLAKTYLVFLLSDRVAILFIWSRAAAILTQTNLMKSPFCRYIFIIKLN